MSRAPTLRSMHRDGHVRAVTIVALILLVMAGILAGPHRAEAATQVELGTAGDFAVLAGETITNTGPTTITGDVGLHPGTDVTGFDDVTFIDGELHATDDTALQAKNALVTAYDQAAGQQPRTTVATQLGGQVLPGGVYDAESGTFQITGTLTLDAQGTPGTVWVFQTAATLVTATDSKVVLLNGADPCNVFWQVGSSATLGTGTTFAGNILALESITLDNSATIVGRALARDAAVTMNENTITRSTCTPPTTDPDPDPTTDPDGDTTSDASEPSDSTGGGPTPAGEGSTPTGSAPPAGGTPQVPVVPTGPVPAGDGSTALDDGRGQAPGLLLLPPLLALGLFAALRRRQA